ncbi:hypothetical protein ACUNWD_15420 [Sunxiuqinia sp. A32]|uniref:hypothetical protein n=1 Tax=Sunxiuqinia sp. A32 TaxID=3461496 RepID=UPI0040467E15
MNSYRDIANDLIQSIHELEGWLINLPDQTVSEKKNNQHRTIKQILGHMVDSASNNTHRVIHLQYQKSPINFPDYANHGNNDRWIAIQNYQDEEWSQLVQLWKYSHLHYCHVIQQVDADKKNQVWISDNNEEFTLDMMVIDFPRHFKLHVSEIQELAKE